MYYGIKPAFRWGSCLGSVQINVEAVVARVYCVRMKSTLHCTSSISIT